MHEQQRSGKTEKGQPQEPGLKMESPTAVTERPLRPKVTARAITTAAAESMLPALADWKGDALTDEQVRSALRLLPGMAYSDTYEMAREFERDGWRADAALVDALEGWDFALRRIHMAAVREWIATYDVRPRFAVGAVVNVPREEGMTSEIASVDEQEGTYTVRIDALGHVRVGLGTHGRVFAWEDVEAATDSAAVMRSVSDALPTCEELAAKLRSGGPELYGGLQGSAAEEEWWAFLGSVADRLTELDQDVAWWRRRFAEECESRYAAEMNHGRGDLFRYTPEHDADLAYWQSHVEQTRRDTLNAAEWPELDAEITRIKEIRAFCASGGSAPRAPAGDHRIAKLIDRLALLDRVIGDTTPRA